MSNPEPDKEGNVYKEYCNNNISFEIYEELDWKRKNRLDVICLYKPGRTLSTYLEARVMKLCSKYNIQNINIGLFGLAGSGKSYIINRLAWFFDKRVCAEEPVSMRQIDFPEYRQESLTTERNKVTIKPGLNVIDNRGITEFSKTVYEEIKRQCEGKVEPDTYVHHKWSSLNRSNCLGRLLPDKIRPNWAIHCPVIVYRLDEEKEPEILQELIDVLYNSTSVFPIIVITFKGKFEDMDKLKLYKKEIPIIDMLHNEEVNRIVAKFHQLHCGRICLIPVNGNENEKEFVLLETMGIIDLLFNCCCIADLKLKKDIMYMDTNGCC